MILYYLSLVMAPFAVYRVAMMLASEEGPFALFEKLRNLYTNNDWIGRGIRCPACLSFWGGLIMATLIALIGNWIVFQVGAIGLGFSGVAVYMSMRRI